MKNKAPKSTESTAAAPLAIGDWVEIEGMGGVGKILALDARRKSARVLVGDQEWTLPRARLRPTAEPPVQQTPSYLVRVHGAGPVAHEIDLHGMRVEDAVEQADRAIDQAVVAHLTQLKIIHGHGTGALRKAVRDLLTRNPHVERFRFGSPAEGGLACTIAELRAARR